MADGGTPIAIIERDEHLQRLRVEAAARARKAELTIAELLAPGRVESLARYAIDPTKLEDRAYEWARDRMDARLRRLKAAQVPIGDQDRLAIALLAPPRKRVLRDSVEVELEVEPGSEESRHLIAIKALRSKFLVGKGFGKSPALAAVRDVLYDRSNNRLVRSVVSLLGSPGVGKTCAASHAIASMDGCRYVKAKGLFDLFMSFHRDDRAELRAMYAAPVLVIDALEDELTAKRSLGPAIDEAIDSRQGARRITILLGNVKPEDLAKMVDRRTHSRLEKIGTVVQIAEADRRRGT